MSSAIQIRFRSILEYHLDLDSGSRRPTNHTDIRKRKTYSGTLTPHGKKRMERSCEFFLQSTKYKMVNNPILNIKHKFHSAFITLTIPLQEYNINQIKKDCFTPFIQKLIRDHKLNKYIWKLEFTKEGMPHFHIITDTWIHYKVIRQTWNKLLANAGYLNEYFKTHSNYNANSTDVHSARNHKSSVAYMVKYISKSFDELPDKLRKNIADNCDKIGKVWDCSLCLKKFKYYTTVAQGYHANILKSLEQAGELIIKSFDYFSLYLLKRLNPYSILEDYERKEYLELINQINTS